MKQRRFSPPSTSSTRTKSYAQLFAGAIALAAGAFVYKHSRTYRSDLAQLQNTWPSAPPLEPGDRLLVVAPHPDDETLATGALIYEARQKDLDVCVIFLTNGDGSGSSYIAQHLRKGRRPTWQELATTRQNEACAALKTLGVEAENLVFLGYPDGGLGAMSHMHFENDTPYFSRWTQSETVPYDNAPSTHANYVGENVVRDLVQVFEEWKPTRIYTTDEHDTHGDHVASYQLTRRAVEQWRTHSADVSSTRSAHATRFFTVLVHHHIWPVPHGLHLRKPLAPPQKLSHLSWAQLAVNNEALRAKQRALECYKSQLVWTPLYLRSFLRRTELFRAIEL